MNRKRQFTLFAAAALVVVPAAGVRASPSAAGAAAPATLVSSADAPSGAPTRWNTEGDQDFGYLGWSVGTAGDVNGDGYDDVIVGATGYDNGQSNEGRAFVYYGSASGLSTTPD